MNIRPENFSKRIDLGNGPRSKLPPISRRRYTDRAMYDDEIEHVWKHSWLLAAHSSLLSEPGDLFLVDLPFAPVFLARGQDGEVRAFLNSCRHRGAALVGENPGCRQRLSCPYHGWTYALDGSLKGVPDREGFPDLKMEELNLRALRCEKLGEFIYVNFDREAPSLEEWLGPLGQRLGDVAASKMRQVHTTSFEVNCNWKIASEAFRESYHVNYVHGRSAAQGLDASGTSLDLYPNGHGLMLVPLKAELSQVDYKGIVANSELPVIDGIDHVDYKKYVLTFCEFPATTYAIQPQGMLIFSIVPCLVNRSRIDMYYFASDWGEGERPEELGGVIAALELLAQEDIANLSTIQRAVESDPELGVQLSTQEALIQQLHAEVDKKIGRERIAPEMQVADFLGDWV